MKPIASWLSWIWNIHWGTFTDKLSADHLMSLLVTMTQNPSLQSQLDLIQILSIPKIVKWVFEHDKSPKRHFVFYSKPWLGQTCGCASRRRSSRNTFQWCMPQSEVPRELLAASSKSLAFGCCLIWSSFDSFGSFEASRHYVVSLVIDHASGTRICGRASTSALFGHRCLRQDCGLSGTSWDLSGRKTAG